MYAMFDKPSKHGWERTWVDPGAGIPEDAIRLLEIPPGSREGLSDQDHGVLSFGPVPPGYARLLQKNLTNMKPGWLVRVIWNEPAEGVAMVHVVFAGNHDDLPIRDMAEAFMEGGEAYFAAHPAEAAVVTQWLHAQIGE